MTEPVRVRLAPSPTGYLHIGNLKTAMYDWILAKHTGGSFILRIEDTDLNRKVEGAIEVLYESLRWMGLDWDEGPDVGGEYGPYIQSERLPLYQEAAEKLVAQGDAYYCYCSSERLEQVRKEQAARKEPPGYDRHCRNLTPEQRADYEAQGIKPVIRFKTPREGQIVHHDLIYGEVTFDASTVNDFVMLKSDGYPTYHLANVVDDHAMKISHVIRAEEWISSVPMHLLIYKALGYQPPQYVHHPMVLGPNRAKLSKRHGDVAVLLYRDKGYLPEALFNFLALIGWSLDDKTEIMTRQELIDNFSLERISKTGALFNREKLEWMNGLYIRNLSLDEFTERVMPFMERDLPETVKRPLDVDYVKRCMELVQERSKTLAEAPELVTFLFTDDIEYEPDMLIGKKMTKEDAVKALEASLEKLKNLAVFDTESMETVLRPLAEELGLKAGQLFGTLRTATTGRTAAPPLFQTMEVLGREKSLARIEEALQKLNT
ncbi:MAG: glutamate--tRNA ligase [Dehalococcoidales bacterium]|nr:glutamate--tRNA ligase [Dehalococcoidales bacterium]